MFYPSPIRDAIVASEAVSIGSPFFIDRGVRYGRLWSQRGVFVMRAAVEVCVESPESAAAAEAGRADRVELCVARVLGGLTPPAADTARACGALAIPVHVLIRPRDGGFVYTGGEFQTMRREVDEAKALGASGVVFGVLHADGTVDRARTAELVALARPLSVTFHKAFDATRDPFEALDVLIDLGVDRVLTSGQAPTAREGLGRLAELVRHAAGRLAVMAGGEVNAADLPGLRGAGLAEVHVGSSVAPTGRTETDRVRTLVAAWKG